MRPSISFRLSLALLLSLLLPVAARAGAPDAAALYTQHCAACHGAQRLGGQGPALLPQNLKRLRRKSALKVIEKGRVQTQMPGFSQTLSAAEIAALTDYIYTPLKQVPEWGLEEIRASHVVHEPELVEGTARSAKPVHDADPLNLFLVVETGDHHVTVLDGDSFEPIYRFKSRFALHGGPKYSSDGRFVYFASRDGWITKFDMYKLKVVAEVRAGINTRNAAVSSDDRTVIVGNYLPHTLVLLRASDLGLVAVIPVTNGTGSTSRVSAVYNAPPRHSFIAALKDIPEVWEIRYDGQQPPGFTPLPRGSHSGAGARIAGGTRQHFAVRRLKVDGYLDDFFFDQGYERLIGAARNGTGRVVNLDTGATIAELPLTGLPHLGSGITWKHGGTTLLATPNLKQGEVTIIDMKTWRTVKTLKTLGPGFFMRSHENSRYAWVDVFFGKHRDAMHVIDKQTLEIVKTLRPEPGKTAAHVEFDRSGRHALVSIWDRKGAVVVYDAETLEEVKRIPMSKPSGKYNVYNKITFSEGTSH